MCLGIHNDESTNAKPNVASIGEKPTSETQTPLERPGNASTGTNKKKAAQKKRRKSNVEKWLEIVMEKFQESANEDFKR